MGSLTGGLATAVRGERRPSARILHPATGSGNDLSFGGRIGGVCRRDARTSGVDRKGGIARSGAVVRRGGGNWDRKSAVTRKGDVARIGGAVPAIVVVVEWILHRATDFSFGDRIGGIGRGDG